jgi:cytoskeletal protein CcmA (bactofilin family)
VFGRARSEARALVPAGEARNGRAHGPSILAADVHLRGNLSSEGEVHIDGRLEGDVVARAITVGRSGRVTGDMLAEEIVVQGEVAGMVRAQRVHLTGTCKVLADIDHDVLCIDEGATFEGQCRRVPPEHLVEPSARLDGGRSPLSDDAATA